MSTERCPIHRLAGCSCEAMRPIRLANGLTPEQDAALDRLAQALADHITSESDA